MESKTTLSEEILTAVAEFEEATRDDLPPLERWVDPQILDQLNSEMDERAAPVGFSYLWYQVTVTPNEAVIVTPG